MPNPKYDTQNFTVQFHKNHPHDSAFSLIGLDASVANAFRRILIAEIPTLAVEHVFIQNNTTIVQDEVLAARLGLVPLTGHPSGLDWINFDKKRREADEEIDHEKEGNTYATDKNTVVLKLKVECTWAKDIRPGETEQDKLYVVKVYGKKEEDGYEMEAGPGVYARHMVFEPAGRQYEEFPEPDGVVRPVNPDILLAKMRPGQVIDLQMHCIKGVGADHAKFSPVATATYRLLPTIEIVKPILSEDARKFARCFPKGVIALEEVTEEESDQMDGEYEGKVGEKKAVVKNTFKDTVSRECLRHEEFQGKVKLGRVRDHFIFSVESTGQYESDSLFIESVRTLKAKCSTMKRNFQVNVVR